MNESPLVTHARREMDRVGLFDKDADYSGALANSVMEIVELFAKQNHSGASAAIAIQLLEKLLRFQTLSPLTSDPGEWGDRSEISGRPIWQNERDPSFFSHDGGKTWYNIDNRA